MKNDEIESIEHKVEQELLPILNDKCDKIIGIIATKVYATSKWVFNRNASPEIDKDIELSEFYETIEDLKNKYTLSTPQDILKDINEALAHLFWYFNGSQKNQTKEEQDNDYFEGKRYLGFLISDMILRQCHDNHICPDRLIIPEYIDYLRGISMNEYIKHKAYLTWHKRNRDSYNKDNGRDLEDYFSSLSFVDSTMINCKSKVCTKNLEAWSDIVEKTDYEYYEKLLQKIIKAKINTLYRSNQNIDKQNALKEVEMFVNNFYPQIFNWLRAGEKPNGDKITIILDNIYGKDELTNMFEFILKCTLLCHLKYDIHADSRKKHHKSVPNKNWGQYNTN